MLVFVIVGDEKVMIAVTHDSDCGGTYCDDVDLNDNGWYIYAHMTTII